MTKDDLQKDIGTILDRAGFYTSEFKGQGTLSFNIVSRRDDLILLIKVLSRKEELSRPMANDILSLARVLKASPILVHPSSGQSPFQDGVLYIRYGIPLMTFNTLFDHLIEEVPPMVYHGPGGFFVSLDAPLLKRLREERRYSLGNLAESLGVSRKSIQLYEAGMGADIEVALGMESFLKVPLILPLDPFSYSEELQAIREGFGDMDSVKKEVFTHLDSLGMEVVATLKCPFDALARDVKELLLTTIGPPSSRLVSRAENLSRVRSVTGGDSVLVVPGSVSAKNIKGTPVLRLSELTKARNVEELIALIRERS
ncbi:MAG: transcriptional regulator [Thermoplasmatota archaeon]